MFVKTLFFCSENKLRDRKQAEIRKAGSRANYQPTPQTPIRTHIPIQNPKTLRKREKQNLIMQFSKIVKCIMKIL